MIWPSYSTPNFACNKSDNLISITSPGLHGPTPAGVPVKSKSPGSKRTVSVVNSINVGMSKIILSVFSCCRTFPLTVQVSSKLCGSDTFDLSTKPATGHDVSNDLARNHGSEIKKIKIVEMRKWLTSLAFEFVLKIASSHVQSKGVTTDVIPCIFLRNLACSLS